MSEIVPNIITGVSLDHSKGAVRIDYDSDSHFVIRQGGQKIAQQILDLYARHESEFPYAPV